MYKISDEQLKIVRAPLKNSIIRACAGSGKTFTVLSRIHHIISNKILKSEEIILITFTRNSTRDMTTRLKKLIKNDLFAISSIDSLAHNFVKKFHPNYSGQILNVKEFILMFLELFYNLENFEKEIEKKITKEGFIFYDLKENDTDFLKKEQHNDLIAEMILKNDELLLYNFQKTLRGIKLVIIDEYQDIDDNQFRLIKNFSKYSYIIGIGDDAQNIYSFRGTNVSYFLDFDKHFSDVYSYNLENNYRSTKEICQLADFILKKIDKNKLIKAIEKNNEENNEEKKENSKPIVNKMSHKNLSEHIKKVFKNKKNNETIAILSRTRFILDDISSELIDLDVPNFLIEENQNLSAEKLEIISNSKIILTTIHKSKGLEFDYVFLIGVNEGIFPSRKGFLLIDKNNNDIKNNDEIIKNNINHMNDELRLYYVAITRAKIKLEIIFNEIPSEFIYCLDLNLIDLKINLNFNYSDIIFSDYVKYLSYELKNKEKKQSLLDIKKIDFDFYNFRKINDLFSKNYLKNTKQLHEELHLSIYIDQYNLYYDIENFLKLYISLLICFTANRKNNKNYFNAKFLPSSIYNYIYGINQKYLLNLLPKIDNIKHEDLKNEDKLKNEKIKKIYFEYYEKHKENIILKYKKLGLILNKDEFFNSQTNRYMDDKMNKIFCDSLHTLVNFESLDLFKIKKDIYRLMQISKFLENGTKIYFYDLQFLLSFSDNKFFKIIHDNFLNFIFGKDLIALKKENIFTNFDKKIIIKNIKIKNKFYDLFSDREFTIKIGDTFNVISIDIFLDNDLSIDIKKLTKIILEFMMENNLELKKGELKKEELKNYKIIFYNPILGNIITYYLNNQNFEELNKTFLNLLDYSIIK